MCITASPDARGEREGLATQRDSGLQGKGPCGIVTVHSEAWLETRTDQEARCMGPGFGAYKEKGLCVPTFRIEMATTGEMEENILEPSIGLSWLSKVRSLAQSHTARVRQGVD